MNLAADLDELASLHQAHGQFTASVGDVKPNGYRLEVTCPCGVTFERWVTQEDAVDDLLREHLRAARN